MLARQLKRSGSIFRRGQGAKERRSSNKSGISNLAPNLLRRRLLFSISSERKKQDGPIRLLLLKLGAAKSLFSSSFLVRVDDVTLVMERSLLYRPSKENRRITRSRNEEAPLPSQSGVKLVHLMKSSSPEGGPIRLPPPPGVAYGPGRKRLLFFSPN